MNRAVVTALAIGAAFGVIGTACGGVAERPAVRSGAAIYRASCATCHGRDGEGFVGPSLYGVAARYPDVADQLQIVTNGRAQMPAFGEQLTPAQIAKVVDYTRNEFVSGSATTSSSGPFIGPTLPSTTER